MTTPGSNRIRTRNTKAFSNLEVDEGQNLMVGFGNKNIASFDAVTGWTRITTKASVPTLSTTHLTGSGSVSFNAVPTIGEAVGLYKAIVLDLTGFDTSDTIEFNIYLAALTNVTNIIVKIGTDASNYMGFTWLVADLGVGWNILKAQISDGVPTGTGWDQSAIIYQSIEITFSNGVTLNGVLLDMLKVTQTSNVDINVSATGLAKETTQLIISGDTTSLDAKIPPKGTAVMVTSTPVTIATDDTRIVALQTELIGISSDTTAIQTAVEIMDDWDEINRCAVNSIAGQVGVQGGAGATTDLTQRTVTSTNSPDVIYLSSINNKEGTTGEVEDADGTRAAQLYYLANRLLALQTSEGLIGAASDVDGDIHGQLRYIGESVASRGVDTWTTATLAWTALPATTWTVDDATVTYDLNGVEEFMVQLDPHTVTGTTLLDIGVQWSFNNTNWTADANSFLAYDDASLTGGILAPVKLTKQMRYVRFKAYGNIVAGVGTIINLHVHRVS